MNEILTRKDILDTIPNRYPILYIDSVMSIDAGKKIVARKNVSNNEDFFKNSFEDAFMPGLLIVETLAQAGSILILKSPEFLGKTAYIGGFNKVEFIDQVRPNDIMDLHFEIIKIKGSVGTANAWATVNGENKVTCQFTFIVGDK
ncbi:3-hydroxyacyl-[acyl-carrier-protein] dehydratase FabZ [Floricoccus penangensis]|uniref:3-hydroxyacyl-[acyl-carrier-protein] dehydratase FabZ n=1 Tax=Floricoccus penangensis TaxID=1859475 RepID=A0A9Q5NZW9_9LACT|nr:3-hydroxyacyl-ACP dehydratase FabZ [Floricoccus penangensis]OFI46837.1 3-hydroxyacyl-[acyl-carrier-protein] dehydratase FabZ [Floricoccus penangensis]